MLGGPFVDVDDRLSLKLTDDINKSKKDGSRGQRRRSKKRYKAVDSTHYTSAVCGFTTDQRINIETLNVQKQSQKDRQAEATIVVLAVE